MKIFQPLLYIFFIFTLISCGEDRSGEYFALIKNDQWIEGTMKEHYLWYNEMPTNEKMNYFSEPSTFLSNIVFKGNSETKADVYSYIEKKERSRSYLQHSSTYGFEFEMYNDPTGTTIHKFARVLYVLPKSPASECGLKRGDWISKINNNNLNTDSYKSLMSGENASLEILSLESKNDSLNWKFETTLPISSSRDVEINPFLIDTIYKIENKNIGYLVYNEFSTGPNNKPEDKQYEEEMKKIFLKFKNSNLDAFILDLRYNPGGYLSQALDLGSMLAPLSALGKTFYTLQYNDKATPQEISTPLRDDLSQYNLNLKKIYIITSGNTASASEVVINCLKPYFGEENVITVGEKTYGKNVAMALYTDDDLDFNLWPVVAYVKNSEGFYQYSSGILPTIELNESNIVSRLIPLGNTNEYILNNTISSIIKGNSNKSSISNKNSKISVIYNSINSRSVKGSRL